MDANLQLLFKIDQELDSSEVKSLKFLCSDVIGKKHLESVTDAQVLFRRLSEQGLMEDDMGFLLELLYTIKRFDLLQHFGKSEQQVLNSLRSNSYLSPYRKMLFSIAEDMVSENLASMKFLVNLPRGKIEASATALDVLTEMEKLQKLNEDNVEELEEILKKCDSQLASKVKEYRLNKTGGDRRPERENSLSSEPMELQSVVMTRQEEEEHLPRDRGQSVVSDAGPVTNDFSQQEDCYPMNSRPRGHCLILNNYIFTHPDYTERKGTGEDAVALRRVFQWLHFTVEEKNDLPGRAMRAVLDDYAKMDHSAYDAVVVCVLSHGQEGSVVGADGEEVSIKDIYRPFTRSPSLVGKPKLFFIQACQGNKFQRGLLLQEDGPQEQPDEDFEEDAYNPLFNKASVASEADILIGMATVEDFKSFRNIRTGSIYIQALCRALESCCPKKEDLLTILTHVNNEVSKGDFNTYKQMPQPKYTLTKKLVLTVD
ncbi:hypothetical protein ACEWY4_001941 [Coilia grayii]|uniref:Caspase-8 n=1 Tax=Coilia grayii TaxID=363190 RepID=A0ABD1KUE3_9TELE